jgi:methylene-tetrahydromethanopterin dehydrogenase
MNEASSVQAVTTLERLDLPVPPKKRGKRGIQAERAPKQAARSTPRKARNAAAAPGTLPVLYMLSPQKFMSPFDCNMAIDSGFSVVLPYANVGANDVCALVQDAIFSRPPNARTGVFIGGKDITLALEMMSAARRSMVPSFEVSVFADPGGSFTTAAAMVACVERALLRNFSRGLKGLRVAVFGATGVVGFASSVIAAAEGANVSIVAHDTIDPLSASAEYAADTFNVGMTPVLGNTDALKSKIIRSADVVFTAGPAGINILTRAQMARASRLLVAADVNAVQPYGIEGMDLFMNGVPLPGCSTLGVGALAIGDVKYKTQAGLFQRMIHSREALELDFRDAFHLAREIVSQRG